MPSFSVNDAHAWFRKFGVPLVVPGKERFCLLLIRSAPFLVWASAAAVLHNLAWALMLRIVGGEVSFNNVEFVEISDDTFLVMTLLTSLVLPLALLVLPWFLARLLARRPAWQGNLLGLFLTPVTVWAVSPAASRLVGIDEGVLADSLGGALLVVAAIFVCIYLGVDTLLHWTLKATYYELWSLSSMVSKVLPVLMIAVLFFFVNGDIWRVADALSFGRTGQVAAVLATLSLLVIVTSSHEKTQRLIGSRHGDKIERFTLEEYRRAAESSGQIWELALRKTNSEALKNSPAIGRLEWYNFSLLPLLAQAIQALMFGVLVCFFFIWFGTIAIPTATISGWLTHEPAAFQLAGLTLPFSAVLVKVSVVLGAFAGLNFVAQTSADAKYSQEFLTPTVEHVRQAVMMRHLYRAYLAEHDLVGEEEHEGGDAGVQNTPGAGVGKDGPQEAAEPGK